MRHTKRPSTAAPESTESKASQKFCWRRRSRSSFCTSRKLCTRIHPSNKPRRTGAQVVQAYVTLPPAPGLPQPPKRLIGFARLDLAPGASGEAAITLDPGASHHPLSVWNEAEKRWVIPQGTFKVWLGTSSAPADLALAGTFTR
ncbi:MAG: hypothetical protein FGM28_09045 [Limnohabitans sp.]|nr:hypothetical protein [Limnohabitans sp.]